MALSITLVYQAYASRTVDRYFFYLTYRFTISLWGDIVRFNYLNNTADKLQNITQKQYSVSS